MPMRHDYLMNHGLASVMQHALEKVPSTCMWIVAPHPPKPKDNLMLFLDSLGNSSATRAPATPIVHPTVAPPVMPIVPPPAVAPLPSISALGARPVPTTSVPVFGGAPFVSVPAGMATGVSLFPTSLSPPPGFKMLPASVHCDLHFLCSHRSVHTKGIYFWHCLAHFHSLNGTPRWKILTS